MLGRELQLIVNLECLELPSQLLPPVLLLVLVCFGSMCFQFHYLLSESNKVRFLVQEQLLLCTQLHVISKAFLLFLLNLLEMLLLSGFQRLLELLDSLLVLQVLLMCLLQLKRCIIVHFCCLMFIRSLGDS